MAVSYSPSSKMFSSPPEASTFRPTVEEFKDPLIYINNIRPTASKFGICKIIPPDGWRPPFSLDVEHMKFSPRIQKLNELEASTRVKLNFFNQIVKFWALQGTGVKLPMVEEKVLDLCSLHKLVQREGGFQVASKTQKWSSIALELGMKEQKGKLIKDHYEKLLLPYDNFKADERHLSKDPPKIHSLTMNRELKSLLVKGAGPKLAELSNILESEVSQYVSAKCKQCGLEGQHLRCVGCGYRYHASCLFSSAYESVQRCFKCALSELEVPAEPYGFLLSLRSYSLQEFGVMADEFKVNYFHKPAHHVDPRVVEEEYWKLLSSFDHDVTVLYGADLNSMDLGSGFPTANKTEVPLMDKHYVESAWNLNNISVLSGSVLSQVNGSIPGMKQPWMYIGMCFSTFCWHTEDHWMYSINYLHWGEPKTWYAVPSSHADDFEVVMKEAASELFQAQPDLLQQLVTTMNPSAFLSKGVPVYRIDQHAGEFVITFPRAYHAGFNQGFNFAEAVNFGTSDWIGVGRLCISHYSKYKRLCIFSHDELVCKMAQKLDTLDLSMALATYLDLKDMVAEEKKLRIMLMEQGVVKSQFCRFSNLPEEDRLCIICKTTLFLSAVECPCKKGRMVCLHHFKQLCDCPPENLILRYLHNSKQLYEMLQKLIKRIAPFVKWHDHTKKILQLSKDSKPDIPALEALLKEANIGRYPVDSVYGNLKRTLAKAISKARHELQGGYRPGKLGNVREFMFMSVVSQQRGLAQILKMPPKKSNLARSTRAARTMHTLRDAESPWERKNRLRERSKRQANLRRDESDDAREQRLREQANRQEELRRRETRAQRERRMQQERERQVMHRAAERDVARQQRLQAQAERQGAFRGKETRAQRRRRLEAQRERQERHRDEESEEARQVRLDQARERQARARANETPEVEEVHEQVNASEKEPRVGGDGAVA